MISPDAGCSPMGIDLHISCFKCSTCSKPLYQTEYRATLQNEFFCDPCYDKVYRFHSTKANSFLAKGDLLYLQLGYRRSGYHIRWKKLPPELLQLLQMLQKSAIRRLHNIRRQCLLHKMLLQVQIGSIKEWTEIERVSAKICARCGKSIIPEDGAQEAKQITIAGVSFHKSCFSCKVR